MTGPYLLFAPSPSAAAQLHQTGHSSIAPHFWRAKVGIADLSAVRCNRAKSARVRSMIDVQGGDPTFAEYAKALDVPPKNRLSARTGFDDVTAPRRHQCAKVGLR
jgi:hypothetical protein